MNADAAIAFGPFVFRDDAGTLHRRGSRVDIGRRGLALLRILVAANGQTVTKSDLMDGAWPNTNVEESNLTVQIAALRKSLGQSPDGGDWIVTVPGVGYRFAIPPIGVGSGDGLAAPIPRQPTSQKPSIAVLPFTNMSSDPEQEYFADGLSEDLITDLSKVTGLMVIARNSSFAYKAKPLDVRQIARDLGVRYLVEGSVRRAAARVRITAQLIDTAENAHLWADRFDRDLADIFALQDEIAGKIVDALSGILPGIRARARQRSTNIEAYDLFVRGRMLSMHSPEGTKSARPLLEASIAIDPNFAEAHAWLAMSHHFGWKYWGESIDPHRSQARDSAERAVTLDPEGADAHWIRGYVRTYDGKLAEGIADFETALRINPNHADAWALLTDLRVFEGRPLDAIDCANTAFRLNPYPPGVYYWVLGWAQYAAGRIEDAVITLRNDAARGTGSQRLLAASLAQLGRIDEAKHEAEQFLVAHPHFTASRWARTQPFVREADLQHFVDGYIKAGLPL